MALVGKIAGGVTTHPPLAGASLKHALAQSEHVEHTRALRAEKHDDALANGEGGRADGHALKASEPAARNTKLQRRSQRAFQIRIHLQRHQRLDSVVVERPTNVERDDLSARDDPRVPSEVTKVRGEDCRRTAVRTCNRNRDGHHGQQCSHRFSQ